MSYHTSGWRHTYWRAHDRVEAASRDEGYPRRRVKVANLESANENLVAGNLGGKPPPGPWGAGPGARAGSGGEGRGDPVATWGRGPGRESRGREPPGVGATGRRCLIFGFLGGQGLGMRGAGLSVLLISSCVPLDFFVSAAFKIGTLRALPDN